MPKFMLTGVAQPISLELNPGLNSIGRNPTNDCRVRDPTVSSFHCEIVLKDDGLLVRDLSSTNGTFVQGRRIEESPLETGWLLRLGHLEFRLERQEAKDVPRIAVPPPARDQPRTEVMLPDGYPACQNHSKLHAVFHCTRCRTKFCPDCVRVLRLTGRRTLVFCPSCSGQCKPLPVPDGVSTLPSEKAQSFLGRLSQTIRLRLK